MFVVELPSITLYSYNTMNNAPDIIHTSLITLDIPAFKSSVKDDAPKNAPSIEESLNAVLAGLTHSLLSASIDEREGIEQRINDIVSMLDRRHW